LQNLLNTWVARRRPNLAPLAVDGIFGSLTGQRVRSFQHATGAPADGVVGPQTWARLTAATPGPTSPVQVGRPNCVTVGGFAFDRHEVTNAMRPAFRQIARRISDSQGGPQPIRAVLVTGHTDHVGTDAYNVGLGTRRAVAAIEAIREEMNAIRIGSGADVQFLPPDSKGKSQPLPGATAADNRRVEVCLAVPAPPNPVPPQPAPPNPVPPPTQVCDPQGRRLLTGGFWTRGTTLTVRGGQSMHFVLQNLNVLGTTITIRDHLGRSQSRIIPPMGSADMVFDNFGCEPMGWTFDVSTNSDAFVVGWRLCSTWVPGDPRNC
jgi:outer membrane protein OmpA-like peptidoglycan-associated protein